MRKCSPACVAFVLVCQCYLVQCAFAGFTPPSNVPYTAAAYADRAKPGNSTGVTGLGSYVSPAGCSAKANLFSQNVSYSVPLLSFLGRAGLNVNLALAYNSKVWVKSGSTIYFNGDNGWPAVGWVVPFGRIDGVYSGPDGSNHYYLVAADGSVHDLRFNATSGLYETTDSTFMDFNDSTGLLRMKDGTQITYSAIGGYVLPIQIKDRNGNYIFIHHTGSGQQIALIVDTLGRSINFSYNADGTLASISATGFGGVARQWTFTYASITLSYNFGSLTVNGSASGSQVKVLPRSSIPTARSRPSATTATRK